MEPEDLGEVLGSADARTRDLLSAHDEIEDQQFEPAICAQRDQHQGAAIVQKA